MQSVCTVCCLVTSATEETPLLRSWKLFNEVMKFSSACGILLISVFTTAHHLSLSSTGKVQFTTSHPIPLTHILRLFPLCGRVFLTSLSFMLYYQNFAVCISLVSHMFHMPRLILCPWFGATLFSNTFSLCSSLNMSSNVSYPNGEWVKISFWLCFIWHMGKYNILK